MTTSPHVPASDDAAQALAVAMLGWLTLAHADLYTRLNALRDGFNARVANYEIYLEDTWNERTPGETHLEYILRSLDTRNETEPLAWDVYLNRQDAKGVWHLEAYQHSVLRPATPQALIDEVMAFIGANTPLVFKQDQA
jgi:hypothetical protein